MERQKASMFVAFAAIAALAGACGEKPADPCETGDCNACAENAMAAFMEGRDGNENSIVLEARERAGKKAWRECKGEDYAEEFATSGRGVTETM